MMCVLHVPNVYLICPIWMSVYVGYLAQKGEIIIIRHGLCKVRKKVVYIIYNWGMWGYVLKGFLFYFQFIFTCFFLHYFNQ